MAAADADADAAAFSSSYQNSLRTVFLSASSSSSILPFFYCITTISTTVIKGHKPFSPTVSDEKATYWVNPPSSSPFNLSFRNVTMSLFLPSNRRRTFLVSEQDAHYSFRAVVQRRDERKNIYPSIHP